MNNIFKEMSKSEETQTIPVGEPTLFLDPQEICMSYGVL